ncbi:MAG TPA: hypothetical protein VFB43_10860 [Terracidiphilus sp.]|nr:hypothetical protein [Terracidiphilus sp.]
MENPLPFFYYDILSRIVPGAATLAVLSIAKGFPPMAWLLSFISAGDREGWEKLAVPIVLLGLCYVIGVIFEVADYFPDLGRLAGMKWFTKQIDRRAFFWAVNEAGTQSDKDLCRESKTKANEIEARRDELWNRLTFLGGSKPEMKAVFEHCHRFQAEQKMFLHLLYPTLLFELVSIRNWMSQWQGPLGLGALALFFICCRSRSRRRWLQTVAFAALIESSSIKAEPEARHTDDGEIHQDSLSTPAPSLQQKTESLAAKGI